MASHRSDIRSRTWHTGHMIESITSMHTTMQQVQTSVMARAIETAETQGQAMVDQIAVSSLPGQSQLLNDPMLGQNADTFA